ncbi:MAG: peptidoglycan-binding domain-containing protein [Minisyncoccia bacterium]
MLRRGIFLLLLALPVAVSAQTFTLQAASTSDALMKEILERAHTILPASPSYLDVLSSPLSSDGVAERLEALLSNRYVPSSVPGSFMASTTGVTVAALLSQVAILQSQIDAIILSRAASTTPIVATGLCPDIPRLLSFGMNGADVGALQNFLISEGLLNADSATGFFGALTEAAVKTWQSAKAIITEGTPATTGYGVVGPKTRAALAACK